MVDTTTLPQIIQPDVNGEFPSPLDGALFMASLGVPQTPLRPRTKIPFLPNFPALASTEFTQIQQWSAQYPGCNFGSVGRVGEYFVFEADTPDVRKRFEAMGHSFTSKLIVASRPDNSRGHRWYKYAPGVTNIQQTFTKHVDFSVRADNMQSVSPGSIHPDTGMQYRLVAWGTPEVPNAAEIAFWESERAEKKDGKVEAPRNERGLIPHGAIHGYLLSQAGRLRQMGLEQDAIEVALLQLVHANCEPPIDETKVSAMAKSICNFPAGQQGYTLALPSSTAPSAAVATTVIEITPDVLMREFPAFDGKVPPLPPMLIDGFLPEGNNFFGSPAGTAKTWAGLSITKALTSGQPLWGVFSVPEKVAVLYLIPEASDLDFKWRLGKFHITQDPTLFRFRTISQGVTRPLNHPLVSAMVEELGAGGRKVLVVTDTAVRFNRGDDENSALENTLMQDSDALRALTLKTGASVNMLFMHHSPKAFKSAEDWTVENVLRGTGDFGAMADAVYGLRRDEELHASGEGPTEVEMRCVKPRNFTPPLPFRLTLYRRPRAGENAPVSVVDESSDVGFIPNHNLKESQGHILVALLKADPTISLSKLAEELKVRKSVVTDLAGKHGWKQTMVMLNGKKKFKWASNVIEFGKAQQADPAPLGQEDTGTSPEDQAAKMAEVHRDLEAAGI